MSLRRRNKQSESQHSHTKEVAPSTAELGIRPSQAAANLVDYAFIFSLVFGGCCTNVWTYEELLNTNPRIGSALTFSQTLFIVVQTLPQFLISPSREVPYPRLKPRQVPVKRWMLQVMVHTGGSLLNNWAFAFNVPLAIQMVFRSAGLAISMLLGYIFMKKTYSATQIISVLLVTLGVTLSTLSRPASPSKQSSDDFRQYIIGVSMLVTSSFLTGILGALQEQTYRKYGPCWREGVFYTHFLSLPIFLFLVSDIKSGFSALAVPSSRFVPYLVLAGNLLTQLICVSGVNSLSSQVSSVSTNLVLTTRKAVSLCFSVWWFGNGWNKQLLLGASMVFTGSILFAAL
ncbi:UAA transporter [Athelia psychrophila]|uniref:UAA transporter n=1 Tax=Athelia psychrophila TaxID=1759441 RepID=A0A166JMX4_9AGAM|nr:UAA transporter [Fibularhizoctonia sp. CBS 109695]